MIPYFAYEIKATLSPNVLYFGKISRYIEIGIVRCLEIGYTFSNVSIMRSKKHFLISFSCYSDTSFPNDGTHHIFTGLSKTKITTATAAFIYRSIYI